MDAAVSTAFALILAVTMAACSGKAQAQGGGGDAGADLKQAADAVKGAAKEVKGAVSKAAAGKPAEASDFVYTLNKAGDGVVITDIQKDAKFGANLVVPAEIEGFPVVAYLASSFSRDKKERDQLVSVVLPDSITYLGNSGAISPARRRVFSSSRRAVFCIGAKERIMAAENIEIADACARPLPQDAPVK
jgi:hypothetical protein